MYSAIFIYLHVSLCKLSCSDVFSGFIFTSNFKEGYNETQRERDREKGRERERERESSMKQVFLGVMTSCILEEAKEYHARMKKI